MKPRNIGLFSLKATFYQFKTTLDNKGSIKIIILLFQIPVIIKLLIILPTGKSVVFRHPKYLQFTPFLETPLIKCYIEHFLDLIVVHKKYNYYRHPKYLQITSFLETPLIRVRSPHFEIVGYT